MDESKLEWFISVVDNKSISKTAQLLYTSPQNVSAYIKRLENAHHATLIDWNGRFSLTPQGEIVYRYFKSIVERDRQLAHQLSAIQQDDVGRIRFGLTKTWAQSIGSQIVPSYKKIHSNIELIFIEAPTISLVQQLKERSIDLYLGKDFNFPASICKHDCWDNSLFVLIPDAIMLQYFGSNHKELSRIWRTSGVYIRDLVSLPFVFVDASTKTSLPIEKYCKKNGISLNYCFQVSHTTMLINLCLVGLGAGFCTRVHLPLAMQNICSSTRNSVNIFPVRDVIVDWKVIVANYADIEQKAYLSDLKTLIKHLNI